MKCVCFMDVGVHVHVCVCFYPGEEMGRMLLHRITCNPEFGLSYSHS